MGVWKESEWPNFWNKKKIIMFKIIFGSWIRGDFPWQTFEENPIIWSNPNDRFGLLIDDLFVDQ